MGFIMGHEGDWQLDILENVQQGVIVSTSLYVCSSRNLTYTTGLHGSVKAATFHLNLPVYTLLSHSLSRTERLRMCSIDFMKNVPRFRLTKL